jgi:hypothetical protein
MAMLYCFSFILSHVIFLLFILLFQHEFAVEIVET